MVETRKNLVDHFGLNSICINNCEITLEKCISYGGRSLVYQGIYNMRKVIVKELYPMLDSVDRRDDCKIVYQDAKMQSMLKEEFESEYKKIIESNADGFVETMSPICYGEVFNTSYIVMEYVKGCTLEQYNKKHLYISMKEILEMILNIAMVVDKHVHQKNMVHLDIKPDNLWVIENQMQYPVIRLLDYGCETEVGNEPIILSKSRGYSPYDIYESGVAELNYDTYSICAILFRLILGFEYDDELSLNVQDIVNSSDFEQADMLKGMSEAGISTIKRILVKGLYGIKEYRYANLGDFISELKKAEKYADTNKIYINPNITKKYYQSIKAKGENKNLYFIGESCVTQYITNDYKYAVEAVVADIINIKKSRNISILKYDISIENTLRNLDITSPPVQGADNMIEWSFKALRDVLEDTYIIIWGIKNISNNELDKVVREIPISGVYLILIGDTSTQSGSNISISVIYNRDYDVGDIFAQKLIILDIIHNIDNMGIRMEDLRNILSEQSANKEIDALIKCKWLFEINGYYFALEDVSQHFRGYISDKIDVEIVMKERDALKCSMVRYFVMTASNTYDKRLRTYCVKLLRYILSKGYPTYDDSYISAFNGVGKVILEERIDVIYDFLSGILRYKQLVGLLYDECCDIEYFWQIVKKYVDKMELCNGKETAHILIKTLFIEVIKMKVYLEAECAVALFYDHLVEKLTPEEKYMIESLMLFKNIVWDTERAKKVANMINKVSVGLNFGEYFCICMSYIWRIIVVENYLDLIEEFIVNSCDVLFFGDRLLIELMQKSLGLDHRSIDEYNKLLGLDYRSIDECNKLIEMLICSDRIFFEVQRKIKGYKRNDEEYFNYTIALIYLNHKNDKIAYKMLSQDIKLLNKGYIVYECGYKKLPDGTVYYYDYFTPQISKECEIKRRHDVLSDVLMRISFIICGDILYEQKEYVSARNVFTSADMWLKPYSIGKWTDKMLCLLYPVMKDYVNAVDYIRYRINQCEEKLSVGEE